MAHADSGGQGAVRAERAVCVAAGGRVAVEDVHVRDAASVGLVLVQLSEESGTARLQLGVAPHGAGRGAGRRRHRRASHRRRPAGTRHRPDVMTLMF